MNINDVLDTLMEFYPWLYTQTGLKSWQLLIIALGVLFLLILFLGYQMKTRVKRIHAIQNVVRSDIIGINLTGRNTSARNTYERRKETALLPDDEEEQQSWGQTTKEWRTLTEKIRNLQHEISKYKRSEKNLKEQITELNRSNESLLSEISKNKELEKELKQQIYKLTNASFSTKQEKTDEDKANRKFQDQSIYSRQRLQKHHEQTTLAKEQQTNPPEPIQINQDIEHIPEKNAANELQSHNGGNKDHILEEIVQQNPEQPETTEREIGVPLDIKELKAIADLAKRLQARSQQHQGE